MAEDKELQKKRARARARARLALQAKQAEAKATEEQQLQGKYTKQSTEVQPSDPWDINPMAPSEVGLDVGTPEQKKALMRNVADGVLLGGAGEVEAAARSVMGQGSYGNLLDQIEMEQRQYKKAAPTAATVQELSGTLVSPANLLRAPAAVQRAGQTAKTAYEVGLPAATYGFLGTEGDLGERAQAAATSGTIGVLGGVTLDKAVGKIANLSNKNKIAPTVSSLKAEEQAKWKEVDLDSILLNRQDMNTVLREASDVAKDYNYVTIKGDATQVERARSMLKSVQGKALTTGQAKKLRTNLYRLADSTKNENKPIVTGIARKFDEYMDKKLKDIGDTAMDDARKATTNLKRAETLQKAFDKIPENATPYTAYRKAAEKIVKDPDQLRRFTKEQQELLQKFSKGDISGRLMNGIGKFTPNANGLLGLLHVVAIGANPYVAILTVGAYGSRAIADKQTTNAAKILVKRMGGVDTVKELAEDPSKATAVQAGLAEKINDIMFGPSEEDNAN